MTETKDKYVVEGTLSACAHTISYYYDLGGYEFSDEELTQIKESGHLEDEAESRARESIAGDYHAGGLNCLYVLGDRDNEITGWWQIETS